MSESNTTNEVTRTNSSDVIEPTQFASKPVRIEDASAAVAYMSLLCDEINHYRSRHLHLQVTYSTFCVALMAAVWQFKAPIKVRPYLIGLVFLIGCFVVWLLIEMRRRCNASKKWLDEVSQATFKFPFRDPCESQVRKIIPAQNTIVYVLTTAGFAIATSIALYL